MCRQATERVRRSEELNKKRERFWVSERRAQTKDDLVYERRSQTALFSNRADLRWRRQRAGQDRDTTSRSLVASRGCRSRCGVVISALWQLEWCDLRLRWCLCISLLLLALLLCSGKECQRLRCEHLRALQSERIERLRSESVVRIETSSSEAFRRARQDLQHLWRGSHDDGR